uniref:Zinc finger protein 271-like isoform X2 n=1 Tax=Drosophila rhopaloa TaxID=1041015 RepID=A0A6P4E7Z6_DRORH
MITTGWLMHFWLCSAVKLVNKIIRTMKTVCRICNLNRGFMINIFDGTSKDVVSIVDVVSNYTGLEIKRGDLFSETICGLCLEDARNSYGIQFGSKENDPLYIKEQVFEIKELHVKEELFEEDLTEEVHVISAYQVKNKVLENCEREGSNSKEITNFPVKKEIFEWEESNIDRTQLFRVQIKNEPIEDELSEKESSSDNDLPSCQVKNEPIEDIPFEEEVFANTEEQPSVPKSCLSKSDFQKSTRNNKKLFKCGLCAVFFSTQTALESHARTHEDRPNSCCHCPKYFPEESLLKEHILTHRRPHKCCHCPKSFLSAYDLKRHTRIHTGERPYSCDQCPKSFSDKTSLTSHIRTHKGERPYKCSECPMSFTQQCNLQRHIRCHTGERPFKCLYCSKTFTQQSNLGLHMRAHSGERFDCSLCSKSFAYNNDLKRHIRIHTEERLQCSLCPKLFATKWSLKKHFHSHSEEVLST